MMPDIQTTVIFCIIGCILVLLLKQYQRVQGVLLSIGICVLVLLTVMPEMRQIFDTAGNKKQSGRFVFQNPVQSSGDFLPDTAGNRYLQRLRRKCHRNSR